jgi:predicted RNA binding protein YcfA (HicA-like mRNA interferase family)
VSPKPLLVSGQKLLKFFKKHGYEEISQRGSHIKIANYATGSTLIIPNHKEIDRWTLKKILKQAEIPDQVFNEYLSKT